MRTVKSEKEEITQMPTEKDTITPLVALTVTPANVVPSGGARYLDAIAYETIVQGQPVAYLEPPSNTATVPFVRLAEAGIYFKVIGIAATGASPNQPVKVILSDPLLTLGGTIAPGDIIYLGITPGALTSTYADLTSGKYVQTLGIGVATGKINLSIVRADVPK